MPPLATRLYAPLILAPAVPVVALRPATRLCVASRPRDVGGFRRGALASEKPAAVAVAEKAGGEGGGGEGEGPYDAIVIGSGIGGLVAATQLAAKGARVLVLEKYLIPGGSSGYYRRDGFTFDVGSSVMFGFSDKGNLNLITQALEAVGRKMESWKSYLTLLQFISTYPVISLSLCIGSMKTSSTNWSANSLTRKKGSLNSTIHAGRSEFTRNLKTKLEKYLELHQKGEEQVPPEDYYDEFDEI